MNTPETPETDEGKVTEPDNPERPESSENPPEPQIEGGGGQFGRVEITIPPGSTDIRQSRWAWIWGGAPWLIVAILFGSQDPGGGFFIFAIGLGIAVTIPRYLGWRKTAYYVTHNAVIFQRGMLGSSQLYNLPAEQFQRVVERPGLFGRYLGYHAIDIRMREGGKVSLAYVPRSAALTDLVIRMRDRYSDYDEEQELRELAMIVARQRGEIPEDFDQPDGSAETPEIQANQATPQAPEMPPARPTEKRPQRPPDRPTEAGEYRPDVREYRAESDERDRR
jgi:hypothetical protein